MKIRELNLIGFGKFNKERLELKEGINIIYGENEAGKTTIHSFINGIFYGFLRPYIKTTRYLDEHSKYAPWSGGKYSGILKFNYKNEDYIIEREFTKGNESTLVFLESTGEDITHKIDNGSRGRILQPGHEFFGFNDSVFSNTISIKQLGSKTEDELANEVRDKIINASTSLDDNLSIEKALEDLNNSLKEIGSSRAPTSIYGRIMGELEEAEKERQRLLAYRQEYDESLQIKQDIDESLTRGEDDLKILKESLADQTIVEKNNLYRTAKKLMREIEVLELEKKSYKKYKDFSMDDYMEASSIKNRIEGLGEKFENLKGEIEEREKKIKAIKIKLAEETSDSRLADDYLRYEDLEEERNKLLYLNNSNKLGFLKRDYQDKEKEVKNYQQLSLIGLILGLALLGFGLINLNYILFLLGAVFTISSIVLFSKGRSKKTKLDEMRIEVNKFQEQEKSRIERIKSIEDLEEKILKIYDVGSKLELGQLYERERSSIFRVAEREESLKEEVKKKENILGEIEKTEEEIVTTRNKLARILEDRDVKNLDEMKKGLEKREIYQARKQEIQNKRMQIENILKDYSLDSLEKDLKAYPKKIEEIESLSSSDQLKLDLEEKNLEIADLKLEKSGLESKLEGLNKEITKLLELDEEIDRKERRLVDLDSRKEAIQLARETIEDLSKTIHRQFAPSINKNVGKIVDRITGSKYQALRIDDRLNISLINPENGQSIDINSLSGGTIDQLYFALRFGIIDSIEDDSPPLILDDCFIQYDDSRLSNMMRYLKEVSRDRQIILFTCHKREIEELERMDLDFNLLKLGESQS